MNKRFLVVGRQFSAMKKALLENGDDFVLLRDVKNSKFTTDNKRRVMCNFSSKESVLTALSKLEGQFDGVVTTYENYVLATSWIAEALHLPGMSGAAARACTDKQLMRSLFLKAPEPISPQFRVVESEAEAKAFASTYGFPLILKPANLAKSLLVTKSHDLNELLDNYQKTTEQIEAVYEKYAPHSKPKLLIEEFLEGSIHSADAFIDKDGKPFVLENVVDYQTGYDIGYEDNFHYSRRLPSALSSQDQAAITHCAELGIKALGMKSSPAHVEVILTKNGARIVEIGARNGGYRERMHKLANDIDITNAALNVAQGKKPLVVSKKDQDCSVLELFPKVPGIFQEIRGLKELKTLPSIKYLSVKANPGQFVGKSSDGYKMCAVIILHHSDKATFDRDLAFVNREIAVVTR